MHGIDLLFITWCPTDMTSGKCFYSAPWSRSGHTLTRQSTELSLNHVKVDTLPRTLPTMASLPLVTARSLSQCSQQRAVPDHGVLAVGYGAV